MELDPSERDLLLRISTAERRWAEAGHDQRSFLLLHLGGMRRTVDHPGWDDAWPVPTSQAIDDLDEYGLLRLRPADGLNRNFVLSTTGRRVARTLEQPLESRESPSRSDGEGTESSADVPSALVSWAHDNAAWQETVLALVLALRANGVDADVDLFHLHDADVEWSTYGPRAIETSDLVLIAVSAAWKGRFDGTHMPTTGAGAAAEADAILGLFDQSNQAAFRSKVKILVLPGASEDDIPLQLRGSVQRFAISELTAEGLEDLLRVIHTQPAFPVPSVGPVPVLPPKFVHDATERTRERAGTWGNEQRQGNLARPAIHGSTAALLHHLQAHGPQTARQLEIALGDIDQIGLAQITEWTAWALETGMIVGAKNDLDEPRWQITTAGQQLVGPP